MKILKLTFKNLNSLKGEHCIDFENGLLAEAGIFSITGPTGAGKSTILDALTLALFGKAARYEGEANPGQMMTRGTGECSAEVLFECRQGRYVAKWTRARSRKKAEGKLQHAKREISAAESGDILAEKLKEADQLVEELTGLDYHRFLRSVLLAQGRFKEFLDAGDNERGDLLEKITGTEIYSRISQKAYELQAEKKATIDQARQLLGALQLKSEEELAALHLEKEEKEVVLHESEIRSIDLKKKLKRCENYHAQKEVRSELEQELQAWQVEDKTFIGERERLLRHEATLPFQADLIKLDNQVSQHRDLSGQLDGLSEDARKKQSEAKSVLLATAAFVDRASGEKRAEIKEGELARCKFEDEQSSIRDWFKRNDADKELEAILPEIRNIGEAIRGLDAEQEGAQERLDRAAGEQQQVESGLAEKKAETAGLSEKLEAQRAALDAAEKSFSQFAEGQSVEHWREQAKFQRKKLEQGRVLQTLRQAWAATLEKVERAKQGLPSLNEAFDVAKRAHCEQLEVNRKEEQVLEDKQRLHQQARLIANLEQQRDDLKAGEACPLCGSEEHPYALGYESNEDADKLVLDKQKNLVLLGREVLENKAKQVAQTESALQHQQKLEQELLTSLVQQGLDFNAAAEGVGYSSPLEEGEAFADFLLELEQKSELTERKVEQLETLDNERNDKRQNFEKLQSEQRVAGSQLENLEQAKIKLVQLEQDLEKSIATTKQQLLSQIEVFNQKLADHGEAVTSADETKTCAEDLEKRVFAYNAKLKELESRKQKIKELGAQHKVLEQDLRRLEEESEAWSDKLQGLELGEEQEGLPEAIIAGDESQRRQRCLHVDDAARQAEQRLKQQNELCGKCSEVIGTETEAIEKALAGVIFASIDELRAARLNDNDLKQLKLKQDELKQRLHTLQGRIAQSEKELKKLEQGGLVSAEEFEGLELEYRELSERQVVGNKRLGEIALLVKQDADARLLQADQIEQIEILEKELRPWSELSALIGSAGGDKFSKFAQGLTLSQLLLLANRHLEEINDRYQIQRVKPEDNDGKESLALQIVDLYQGDAVRPTRSLSGGESFLISLALALGLSDLAGSDTRIESLFIDEGFGTLDSDTLDMALAALENLRLSNRTIGIISHVDALKQRISAQIQVSKSNDGFGALQVALGL